VKVKVTEMIEGNVGTCVNMI